MPSGAGITHLLFDLGDVLVELDWAGAARKLGLDDAFLSVRGSEDHDLFERGSIGAGEFFARLRGRLGLPHSLEAMREAWGTVVMRELPGVRDVLREAAGRGAGLFALSNADEVHMSRVRRLGFMADLKRVFASHELRCRKPELEIYLKALQGMGCRPEQVLFIDDKTENVEGARRLGLKAERCENSAPDLRAILRRHLAHR